jgi:hypothetical protein
MSPFTIPRKWLVVRLLIIAINVGGIIVISRDPRLTLVDWRDCFSISVLISVALSATMVFLLTVSLPMSRLRQEIDLSDSRWKLWWKSLTRYHQEVDWSEPYSWWKPFWPMKRYPLRYWLFAPQVLMIAGIAAMLADVISHKGQETVGGMFFFVGLLVWLALKIWIKKFWRSV